MAAPFRHAGGLPCEDFMQFQNALRKLRLLDDRINYHLNTSIPTRSFAAQVDATETCQQLYKQISDAYTERRSAIESCIQKKSAAVEQLKTARTTATENEGYVIRKKLQNAQTELRLVRAELDVERVLHEQTTKIFYERCRDSYRPPNL